MNEQDPLLTGLPPPIAMSIDIEPGRIRQIIEGLRALPNVNEMPIITAIAELDRIASMFEKAAEAQSAMIKSVAESMRSAIIAGRAMPTEGCTCERCKMIRTVLAEHEKQRSQPLNS